MPGSTERRRARQQQFAQRLMERLRTVDPDLHRQLEEAGLARRATTDVGDGHDIADGDAGPEPAGTGLLVNPMFAIERLLERHVEKRPSMLGSLGLSAIQILSSSVDGDGPGIPTPLTVVFTDLEGFTSFTEAEGDDAASRLLHDHHRTVGPIVRGRGGRVIKRLGDGLLLTFPEPAAAVLCGVEMTENQPAPLRLRAGMHCGGVVVTRDDVVGHVVNVSARVAEAADGGAVLVTSTVREAADDLPGLTWGPLEPRSFRGLNDPIAVCHVRRGGPTEEPA
ncbi:MAG TPA: adenylate/guanylate cyclase domain-containing protein [Acidimicrobiales bacterium]|nr:adenylate/guanylate cyclase domain-containing protein [Acidimicrobiales bacterium]